MTAPIAVLCHEKHGDVVRRVRQMTLTPQNLRIFWEKSKGFKTLFTEEVNGDFKKFLEVFLHQTPDGGVEANGLFWVVDDFVGVLYLTDIIPKVDALAHFTFFDRGLRGREDLVKQMLEFGFRRYRFHRMSVIVALYANPATFKFVERLGFKWEGRKRSCRQYNGQWFDANLYGILSDEVLNATPSENGGRRPGNWTR